MKKFLIICIVLFIAGVGCKKENVGGTGLCACSPVIGPDLRLVIKNSAGDDLLNENTSGAYTTDKIEFYRKDASGKITPLTFSIRAPFAYGNQEFAYNTISVPVDFLQQKAGQPIYLKLGDKNVYELNAALNKQKNDVEKLLIGDTTAERDSSEVSKLSPIFYLTE
ncbi:hypothetical protein GCM10023149_04560 [Mucilaginibacter gynuensis]|uniref:Lipoprotein n=1 Tax=Mucilaginibacter gynuensis TaxID=1302236 RepID=A0ABP8FS89_9SPHI